jgi:hypothetical protein
MKTRIKLTIYILAAVTIGTIAWLFTNSEFMREKHAKCADVLGITIPREVVCVNHKLNMFGRERIIYDYRVLLRGDTRGLNECISLLDLKERDVAGYKEQEHLKRQSMMNWWNPPSADNRVTYRVFEQRTGKPNTEGGYYRHIVAELASNELYLLQVGDIASMQEQLRKAGAAR